MQNSTASASVTMVKKRDSGTFMPQLTSLIDVMTILLVFLIKSFSSDATIVTPSKDLELPLSSSKCEPTSAASIEVTRQGVLVEGTCVTRWSDLSGSDSLVIPSLLVRLQQVQALAQSKRSARAIMIQSDKSVAFSELKKVFYTCSRAGFSDFSILVIEQG